ncbi:MAG: hypothetical protein ACTHXA_08605 [Gulosibacter sp.]|uniref:hypothetical protein n=1 Tax=Gulosibacter sp. TaxID=2817531 RepID=UPI003F9177EB
MNIIHYGSPYPLIDDDDRIASIAAIARVVEPCLNVSCPRHEEATHGRPCFPVRAFFPEGWVCPERIALEVDTRGRRGLDLAERKAKRERAAWREQVNERKRIRRNHGRFAAVANAAARARTEEANEE